MLGALCGFMVCLRHDSSPTAWTAPSRRQSVLLLSGATASGAVVGGGARPASARSSSQLTKSNEEEFIEVPENPSTGRRPYAFTKPAGFKQLASPIDPTSLVFRNKEDGQFSFVSRYEFSPNASTTFTPQAFINDYENKFTNATGSTFTLIKGGGPPEKQELDAVYYTVEYTVKTQLGFTFDTLRTLHFITAFAVIENGFYLLNFQVPEEKWEGEKSKIKKVIESFKVTG